MSSSDRWLETRPTPVLFSLQVSNAVLRGLTLDGGGASFANSNPLVTGYNVSGLLVDNDAFQNAAGTGALMSQVSYSGFRGSTFFNVGNLYKTTGQNADRHQAIAFCCGASAIGGANGIGNFADGNTFSDIGLDDISATNLTRVRATNNECSQLTNTMAATSANAGAACIYANVVTHIYVAGNKSSGNTAYDLAASSDITTNGNQCLGTFYATCFSIYSAINGSFTGDLAKDSQGSGFLLAGTAAAPSAHLRFTGVQAFDDQSTKTQQYGVGILKNAAADAVITDVAIDPGSNMLNGNGTANISPLLALNGAWGPWSPTIISNGSAASAPVPTARFSENGQHTVTFTVTLLVPAANVPLTISLPVAAGASASATAVGYDRRGMEHPGA